LAALHGLLALLPPLEALTPSAGTFELVSGAFLAASRFCAALDPGLTLPPLGALQLVVCCLAAFVCMLPIARSTRRLALCGLLALGLLDEWRARHALADDRVRVTFLDVGQ